MRKSKIFLIFMVLILLLTSNNVYGVGLQANKNGNSKSNVASGDFFEPIKKMESSDGTLGISDHTKIDCHMALSTEWGTAALLMVSDYGSNSNNSTTGNETGIKNLQDGKSEFVAGVWKGNTRQELTSIMSANPIYRNEYDDNLSKSFRGDAFNMGSNTGTRFSVGNPALIRNEFSYTASFGNSGSASRAVVVNVGGIWNWE